MADEFSLGTMALWHGGRRWLRAARIGLAFTAASVASVSAIAKQQPNGWRELARVDLRAAHVMLLANHPGFAPQAGDAALRHREALAYRRAVRGLSRVTTLGGYRAALDRYLAAMGDGHIAAYPLVRPSRLRWPGFLVAARGSRWEVVESAGGALPANGARWLGCDGRTAEAIAAERVGSVMPWSLPAHRRTNSPFVLVDRGDPFVAPLHNCRFADASGERRFAMAWREASSAQINRAVAAATGLADARFDLRTAPDGALWIGYGEMSDRVAPVLAAIDAKPELFARAPYVVVDVRGNGGGDSRFADELAKRLFPDRPPAAAPPPAEQRWRASPANASALMGWARDDPASAEWLTALAREMRLAIKAGRSFSAPLPPRPWPAPPPQPASGDPRKTRVLVLTDAVCFSSCLVLVDRFRRFGAAQIGMPTDASTRYVSGRRAPLPSGLSELMVMQAMNVDSGGFAQPFVPTATFDCDMRDEAALMAWVADLRVQPEGAMR